MNSLLKDTFIQLIKRYADNNSLAESLWSDLEKAYNNKKRYYHNLQHLENLLTALQAVQQEIQHWDATLFALYYHDIVYNVLKTTNEEKSAWLAQKIMQDLQVPTELIDVTGRQIRATQSHQSSDMMDVNFFTDADLGMLGARWDQYERYFKNIRKEYAFYPDIIYNPGRKKVLQHFLQMHRLFKTEIFFKNFEDQARQNLKNELALY